LMGSPAYMSPEQVEGDAEKMGPCCDIYSLGVIFYELLAGRVPFEGSIASVMGQVMTAIPKPPSVYKPGIDPAIEAVCLRMLAKQPEDRFASMREVAVALESYLEGRATASTVRNRPAPPTEVLPAVREQTRGVVVPHWILWTAVVVVAAAFGTTWWLIAITMKQTQQVFDRSTQEAVTKGEARLVLNHETLPQDQVQWPIPLRGGTNDLEVNQDGKTTSTTIDVPKDVPYYLVDFTPEPLPRAVADWTLANGGKMKINGSNDPISDPALVPKGKLVITDLDLSGVILVPNQELDLICRLGDSLKELVLPKGTPLHRIEKIHQDLPKCHVTTNGT
jgi:Protein kinase domain